MHIPTPILNMESKLRKEGAVKPCCSRRSWALLYPHPHSPRLDATSDTGFPRLSGTCLAQHEKQRSAGTVDPAKCLRSSESGLRCSQIRLWHEQTRWKERL